jgi:hypothetical protein
MAEAKTNGAIPIAAPHSGAALMVKRRATPLDITKVAARAEVSPNTVRRYLAGKGTYSTTRSRIEKALVKCGLPALVRAQSPAG